MNKTFETIERLAHVAIDAAAKVAVAIAKAIITLICLGASVSYETGKQLGRKFRNYNATTPDAKSDTTNNTVQETKPPINNSTEPLTCELVHPPQPQELVVALDDANKAADEIIEVIDSIIFVERPSQVNYLHRFVTANLRDTLETNYLSSVSYKLPRNKRTKRAYRRHGDYGVLVEHSPIVEVLGLLST